MRGFPPLKNFLETQLTLPIAPVYRLIYKTVTTTHMHNYALKEVFLCGLQFSVFFYTGGTNWIIDLNVESKESFAMVDSEQQFFSIP